MESYRQQEILAISESELDSSCGITFLFENLDSIKEFYGEILWMKYEMFNLLFYFNTNGLVKNEIIQLGEEDIKKELMKEKQKEGNKQ